MYIEIFDGERLHVFDDCVAFRYEDFEAFVNVVLADLSVVPIRFKDESAWIKCER